jgi:dCMP deaminase
LQPVASCLKRRVGAIVVDDKGHTLSSGYNEILGTDIDETCARQYGKWYRDLIKGKFSSRLKDLGVDEAKSQLIQETMWVEFKMLDRCRALHAEEQAILNLAVSGARLTKDARMFVTTYPCNLCANKIVRMGIRKVVYFEPYPVRESMEILNSGGVSQQAFAGATFNGYFRLFGGVPHGAVP